jgi:enoyl-CoA hydratase/carnithine racemase
MMTSNIKTTTKGKVRIITLDRPAKLNALTVQMDIDLVRAFRAAEMDDDIASLVLRGEGRCFSAGHDLMEVGTIMAQLGEKASDWDEVYARIWPEGSPVHALYSCTKPIVAALKGYVVGMTIPLVMSADIIVAASGTEFNLEVLRTGGGAGLAPYAGLIPPNLLSELAYTGKLKAEKLAACGVINELTDLETLDERAMFYAEAATKIMPYSAKSFKSVVRKIFADINVGRPDSMQAGGKTSHGDDNDTKFWVTAAETGVRSAIAWRDKETDARPLADN